MKSAATSIIVPVKIGIFKGNLGKVNVDTLQYLIVHLNTLQAMFEFEILPISKDEIFLKYSYEKKVMDRPWVRENLKAFRERMLVDLVKLSDDYKISEASLPQKFIFLTMNTFNDDYYSTRSNGVTVLALGNWERYMAPPSLLEFFITLILRQAVALESKSLSSSVHLGSKGCLFDFNYELKEARLKVLQGFICRDCREKLIADGYPYFPDHLISVLDTSRWLGDTKDPRTPAGIVSNLGYDLFKTKGIEPNFREKSIALIKEEGVKKILDLVIALVIAGLLLKLGWK